MTTANSTPEQDEKRADAFDRFKAVILDLGAHDVPTEELDEWFEDCLKLDKLAAKVHLISDDDRKFFERFPQQKFRIRLAGQAELDQQELINGRLQNCSSDNLVYVLVQNIKPGAQMRVFVLGPDNMDTDLRDDTLQMLWDIVTSEGVQTF